jgi:hypothetical protein
MIDQVRQAARDLHVANGGAPFTMNDLADEMGLSTFADKAKVQGQQVASLVQSGELEQTKPGVYRYTGKKPGQPNQQEIMWRVLRARKVVTVPDLVELAGATEDYAREFLRRLYKQAVIMEVAGPQGRGIWIKYRLVDDPGPELPKNEAKATYLRARREKHQAALAALDGVYLKAHELMQAAAAARVAVSGLEET